MSKIDDDDDDVASQPGQVSLWTLRDSGRVDKLNTSFGWEKGITSLGWQLITTAQYLKHPSGWKNARNVVSWLSANSLKLLPLDVIF